ncbi:ABC transporter permease [Arthrobacter sp. SLBN-53]|uniref:MlaE family ABC transporter permease n=1 Tax=Arthrobacter sp. SLBN-53 TaxID=2768412 RepID=UPI001169CC15|nr:ABC transporter permease [Arthrobacter sp. SLBN-53]TQK32063.1 phospholipid/cholesterol/gamma-HCH transport system permease protein [Arthrobacter sp. SLBN-53]
MAIVDRGLDRAPAVIKRVLHAHPIAALETVGAQVALGVRVMQYTVLDGVRLRTDLVETLKQAAFMSATAFTPTVLVTIPICVTLSIQFALVAGQVGASSLAGAATGMVVIRQGAPLVASLLLATAVGSAVCADLGSRAIREEIEALQVMGIDPVRRLVVPRLVAIVVIGILLTGMTTFVGFIASYLFTVYVQEGTPGSFVATFASFSTIGDLWLAIGKSAVFGVIVAVVCCHKGLTTRGGPAGVANSVNAAVVEAVLLMMIVNLTLSQVYDLVFPRATL